MFRIWVSFNKKKKIKKNKWSSSGKEEKVKISGDEFISLWRFASASLTDRLSNFLLFRSSFHVKGPVWNWFLFIRILFSQNIFTYWKNEFHWWLLSLLIIMIVFLTKEVNIYFFLYKNVQVSEQSCMNLFSHSRQANIFNGSIIL